MIINKEIEAHLEKFIIEIKETLSSKKLDDTKKLSDSLVINNDKAVYWIEGEDYIQYLNRGRSPGQTPPPIAPLIEWCKRKAPDVNPYALQKKMAKDGSVIFRKPENGLELEKRTKEFVDKLEEAITIEITNKIKIELNEAIKRK